MPRKRSKSPVAKHIEAQAELAEAQLSSGYPEQHPPVAEAQPEVALAAPAYLHATSREPLDDVSFDVASFAQESKVEAAEPAKPEAAAEPKRRPNARYAQINSVGIAVECEMEARKPWLQPQTLILFRDDAKPSADEKAKLSDAGFSYQSGAQGWGMPRTAVSLVLAKRLVSELAKGRGDEGVSLYV